MVRKKATTRRKTTTRRKAPAKKKKAKSRVNEAGNYTKPTMRKRLFQRIKAVARVVHPDNGLHVKLKC